MQFPTIPDEWMPIAGSTQLLDVAVSTALTVPAVGAGQIPKGAVYVGILTAQLIRQWLKYDGSAVTPSVTGGELMEPGDYVVIYGVQALKAVRVVRNATGGSLAARYYYFRPTL